MPEASLLCCGLEHSLCSAHGGVPSWRAPRLWRSRCWSVEVVWGVVVRVDNPSDVASDFNVFVRLVPRPLTTQWPQISREKPHHFTANTKAETHRDAEQQTISCVPAIGRVSCSLAPSIGPTRHNLGVNRSKNHTHHPRVAIAPIVQNATAAPPRHALKQLTILT